MKDGVFRLAGTELESVNADQETRVREDSQIWRCEVIVNAAVPPVRRPDGPQQETGSGRRTACALPLLVSTITEKSRCLEIRNVPQDPVEPSSSNAMPQRSVRSWKNCPATRRPARRRRTVRRCSPPRDRPNATRTRVLPALMRTASRGADGSGSTRPGLDRPVDIRTPEGVQRWCTELGIRGKELLKAVQPSVLASTASRNTSVPAGISWKG